MGKGRTRPEERMRDRQQHTVITAILGGLLGTLGQMLLVYGVAPLMAYSATLCGLVGAPAPTDQEMAQPR